MTLPGLIQNYQKNLLKNQYKTAYSKFLDALKLAQAKQGAPIQCYYWVKSPYRPAICLEKNEFGTCKKYEMPDGSPLPSNYNGEMGDCSRFINTTKELFGDTIKISKHCKNNSLANGCITKDYRGIDKVKAELDPNVNIDPNTQFSDSRMKNVCQSWILTDGTLIMNYDKHTPLFMIDINGHKRPNKWGYDMFTFQLKGNPANGITKLTPINYYYEEGGFSSVNMLFNAFNK